MESRLRNISLTILKEVMKVAAQCSATTATSHGLSFSVWPLTTALPVSNSLPASYEYGTACACPEKFK